METTCCQDHFNKKADKWHLLYEKPAFQDRLNVFVENLTEVLSPPAKILDYGCGSGVISFALANLGFEVTGMDAAKEMVSRGEKERVALGVENLKFQAINPDEFTPTSSSYDAIVCSSVVEYVDKDEDLLTKFSASLKPGGFLLFSIPHKTSIVGMLEDLLVKIGVRKSDINFSKRRYCLNYILKFLSTLSFNSFKYVYFEMPKLGKLGIYLSRCKYLGVMIFIRSRKTI